jgi:hypothetical protein
LSYKNISSVTKTLAAKIWACIKEDTELSQIISKKEQIITTSPDSIDKVALVSIFLYEISEATNMRNQPQNPGEPRTLLHFNLHYLITPLTCNTETSQIIIGKILQFFTEKPILRNTDLQGNLKDSQTQLKITLDQLAIDDINNLWTMLSTPYKLSISYCVSPVELKSDTKQVSTSKTLLSEKTKKEKRA